MTPSRLHRSWTWLSACLLLAACGGAPPDSDPGGTPDPRLVLLYAPCTLNKDFLSPYNDGVTFTPHLARFADESVVFARHHTETGASGIAYASLFTGSQAESHGVFSHPSTLDDSVHTIAEAFADRGYETFFWNRQGLASSLLNYDQGVPAANVFNVPLTHDHPAFVALLGRLKSDPSYRAFVMTNFTETHAPYSNRISEFTERYPDQRIADPSVAVAEYAELHRANHIGLSSNFPETIIRLGLSNPELEHLVEVIDLLYRANVEHLDRMFGAVVSSLRAAELLDDSLVVFTADHGELLYRDNAPFKWSHSLQLVPEVLGVPLIVRWPRAGRGRYEGITRSADVFPTVLGLLGSALPDDSGVTGVDLSPAIEGQQSVPDLSAFSHTSVLSRLVARRMQNPKRADHWKLAERLFPSRDPGLMWVSVRNGEMVYKLENPTGHGFQFRAFRLESDPQERNDLFDENDPTHREMAARLTEYKEALLRSYAAIDRDTVPPREELEALRNLGYVN